MSILKIWKKLFLQSKNIVTKGYEKVTKTEYVQKMRYAGSSVSSASKFLFAFALGRFSIFYLFLVSLLSFFAEYFFVIKSLFFLIIKKIEIKTRDYFNFLIFGVLLIYSSVKNTIAQTIYIVLHLIVDFTTGPLANKINFASKKQAFLAASLLLIPNIFFTLKFYKNFPNTLKQIDKTILNSQTFPMASQIFTKFNIQTLTSDNNAPRFQGEIDFSFEQETEVLDFVEKFSIPSVCGKLFYKKAQAIHSEHQNIVSRYTISGEVKKIPLNQYFPFKFNLLEFVFVNNLLLPQVSQLVATQNSLTLSPQVQNCFVTSTIKSGSYFEKPAVKFMVFFNESSIQHLLWLLLPISLILFFILMINFMKQLQISSLFSRFFIIGLYLIIQNVPAIFGIYQTLLWNKLFLTIYVFLFLEGIFSFFANNKSLHIKNGVAIIGWLFASLYFWVWL